MHVPIISLRSFSTRQSTFPQSHCSKFTSHSRHIVVSAGFQQPLTNAERKAKRADAQRLGKNIVLIQLGQKGITPTFIEGVNSALAKNELIKVRVGGDEAIEEVVPAIEEACDCIVVHKIGFVLTLYRDKSLPPVTGSKAAQALADAAELVELEKERKRAKRGPKKGPELPPPPPEFTVLS